MAKRRNPSVKGACKRSWHREESQDLAHDAIALIGLEKKLSVRGTIHNDQFLRLRSFFALRTNARKPWAAVVASSLATMNRAPDFSFSAERFGAALPDRWR